MDGAARQPAAEQVYEALRARIMTGRLAAGTRLTEQSLAREMGLSRTPIRQAVARLVHEGFAERGDGYSTRVADFPEEDLEQIFEVRRRLEALAAERAATRATEAEIDTLSSLTDEMEALTPPRTDAEIQRIAEVNTAFHRTIAGAARSPRLAAILALAVDIGLVARTYRSYSEADLVRSCRHHRELVDAIRARAPDWAGHVMSSHVLAAARSAKAGRPGT